MTHIDFNQDAFIEKSTRIHLERIFKGVISDDFAMSRFVADYEDSLYRGKHLITQRLGYTHHGIYAGNNSVIHYSGLAEGPLSGGGPVERVSLREFSGGPKVRIKEHPNATFSGDEALNRAHSRVGETDYNLVFNNCEHFVNWCLYDVPACHQVQSVAGGATKALLRNPRAALIPPMANTVSSLKNCIEGKITFRRFTEEASHNMVAGASAFYYGALGQLLIPVPFFGAFVGSTVGFYIGSVLQASGALALGESPEAKAARDRREKIEALCSQATSAVKKSRENVEKFLEDHFASRRSVIMESLDAMNGGGQAHSVDDYVDALGNLNGLFNKELSIKTFKEFDDIMLSGQKLKF